MSGPWRVHDDDPVVVQPDLAELVELARNQRVPTLRTTASMVSTHAAAHAHRRRRTWLAVAGVGALAAALLVSFGPRILDRRDDVAPSSAVHDDATPPTEGDVQIGVPAPAPEPEVAPPIAPAPVEAPQVSIVPEIETPLQQPKPADGPPTAAELARAAERSMAAGRRDETIRLLSQLVRRYPKSSPARAALFDLGRLLRASGRTDEARCAYRLLRQRWPGDAMRGEIDRVLKTLGDGPECRGLHPLP
jgi:hypothetical protein